MSKSLLLTFIGYYQHNQEQVTVFLTNGVKLTGSIGEYDLESMTLHRDGISQLVRYPAVATILPQTSFKLHG